MLFITQIMCKNDSNYEVVQTLPIIFRNFLKISEKDPKTLDQHLLASLTFNRS